MYLQYISLTIRKSKNVSFALADGNPKKKRYVFRRIGLMD